MQNSTFVYQTDSLFPMYYSHDSYMIWLVTGKKPRGGLYYSYTKTPVSFLYMIYIVDIQSIASVK